MSHTPGPWHIGYNDLRGGRYWWVSRGQEMDLATDLHEDENGKADAHLIAAAPDLLKALEQAHEALHWHDGLDFQPSGSGGVSISRIINDVLAKARGQ